MPKPLLKKGKVAPWIPPGKGVRKDAQCPKLKPATKYKEGEPISPKTSPKKTTDISKEVPKKKDVECDVMSLSSHSSYEAQSEADIHLVSMLHDLKLLLVHFESLKPLYLSAYRLIDPQEIGDGSIKKLFAESEVYVKELNNHFDELEFSITVLENTLDENQKIQEYSKAFECKQKLLSKLLDLYEKVIIIFESVFEKQDFNEMVHMQEHLTEKLKVTEKRAISQEAVIKDLERRLSIYQSKSNAMESYKTNLESAKSELEKQLQYKESQIKYLSNELKDASGTQTKSDREEFIDIIERIKSKAHDDKSKLKKALKFQKQEFEKHVKELKQELNEKEKMMFDLATQRDQLKVQLTVINNDIIQQKSRIEEMKNQNLKLQNEMNEKDMSHKSTIKDLQNAIEEKTSELDKSKKTIGKLKETVEELEDDLQKLKKHRKNSKAVDESQTFVDLHKTKETDLHAEIQHLSSLLQNMREVLESLKQTSHINSAVDDYTISDTKFSSVQNEILAAVKETKEHLLELKNMCKSFPQKKNEFPEQKDHTKTNDMEKQLEKMQHLYDITMKENLELKQEIEELRNSSLVVQKNENNFATGIANDNFTRKLQLEFRKKTEEIKKLKNDFKLKEEHLEDQLNDCKRKLRLLEVDSMKIPILEEDLKNTKLELSVLQKKKEEETEKLLQRTKELEDSLYAKSAELECLQRYKEMLRSSFCNVFGDDSRPYI